jgi:hypothetical protein
MIIVASDPRLREPVSLAVISASERSLSIPVHDLATG